MEGSNWLSSCLLALHFCMPALGLIFCVLCDTVALKAG